MNSFTTAAVVFGCVFGGALLGIFIRRILPHHHLNSESKNTVKLRMGLVGTMAALVLGLLVASAKGSYDAQSAELTQMSANIAVLGRLFALYGSDSKEARTQLRGAPTRMLDQLWSRNGAGPTGSSPTTASGESLYATIQELSPKSDTQRSLQNQALRHGGGYRKDALVDVRAGHDVDLPAPADHPRALAHHDLHHLRPFCPVQLDGGRQSVRLRAGGVRGHLLDPGDVLALRGADPDLQSSAARGHRAPRPVAGVVSNQVQVA